MPLPNPFRRPSERPSLRERAADLRDRLVRSERPTAAAPAAEAAPPADTLDPSFATDSEILSLGRHLDAAHAAWREAEQANREPTARYEKAINEARARGGPSADELRAAWDLPGVEAAHAAEDDAFAALDPICKAIWQAPAATPAGLAVKARAALVHIWTRGEYEAAAALGDEEDLREQSARRLIEACCAMAGVNWKGEPVAAPSNPGALALVAAIEAEWAAQPDYDTTYNDPSHDDEFEAQDERRRSLIDAAEALPATRANLTPKVLALAWIEFADLWERGRRRERYATDGRLALDIDAIMRRPESRSDLPGSAASAQPSIGAAFTLDFASASVEDLRVIRWKMTHMSDAAYAMAAHGDAAGGILHDRLVEMGEAFTAVVDGALAELQRRRPRDARERETRLVGIAERVLLNGDHAETSAYLAELAAWSAECANR